MHWYRYIHWRSNYSKSPQALFPIKPDLVDIDKPCDTTDTHTDLLGSGVTADSREFQEKRRRGPTGYQIVVLFFSCQDARVPGPVESSGRF